LALVFALSAASAAISLSLLFHEGWIGKRLKIRVHGRESFESHFSLLQHCAAHLKNFVKYKFFAALVYSIVYDLDFL
jgi:hypothetical protein